MTALATKITRDYKAVGVYGSRIPSARQAKSRFIHPPVLLNNGQSRRNSA
jgi:hypothetical protein